MSIPPVCQAGLTGAPLSNSAILDAMPQHADSPATILTRLDEIYPAAADPVRAVGARAYMRDQFPFLGITNPRLTELNREVLAGLGPPAEADLVDVALGCWAKPEREYQYFACTYLRKHVGVGSPRCFAPYGSSSRRSRGGTQWTLSPRTPSARW